MCDRSACTRRGQGRRLIVAWPRRGGGLGGIEVGAEFVAVAKASADDLLEMMRGQKAPIAYQSRDVLLRRPYDVGKATLAARENHRSTERGDGSLIEMGWQHERGIGHFGWLQLITTIRNPLVVAPATTSVL